jgi:hypothetical protein
VRRAARSGLARLRIESANERLAPTRLGRHHDHAARDGGVAVVELDRGTLGLDHGEREGVGGLCDDLADGVTVLPRLDRVDGAVPRLGDAVLADVAEVDERGVEGGVLVGGGGGSGRGDVDRAGHANAHVG